jgi:hypothetical protein
LLNRIRTALGCVLAFALWGGAAIASAPTVAQVDAAARAVGNRRDVAEQIGTVIFATRWPAEVSQISANELAGHLIVGIRVLGVKFHEQMRRSDFADEVVTLVEKAFAAVPSAEEVDLWASVPISVAKGVIVSGDLAKPTSRTVFSISVRRGEDAASLRARIQRSEGVFWDDAWAESAFKPNV